MIKIMLKDALLLGFHNRHYESLIAVDNFKDYESTAVIRLLNLYENGGFKRLQQEIMFVIDQVYALNEKQKIECSDFFAEKEFVQGETYEHIVKWYFNLNNKENNDGRINH